jgi:hypothetical protein
LHQCLPATTTTTRIPTPTTTTPHHQCQPPNHTTEFASVPSSHYHYYSYSYSYHYYPSPPMPTTRPHNRICISAFQPLPLLLVFLLLPLLPLTTNANHPTTQRNLRQCLPATTTTTRIPTPTTTTPHHQCQPPDHTTEFASVPSSHYHYYSYSYSYHYYPSPPMPTTRPHNGICVNAFQSLPLLLVFLLLPLLPLTTYANHLTTQRNLLLYLPEGICQQQRQYNDPDSEEQGV